MDNRKDITQQKHKQLFSCPSPDTSILFISSLPHISEKDKITLFYQRLGEKCSDFCQRSLIKTLDATNRQYTYRICCKPIFCDEDRIQISLTVTLYDSLRGKKLIKYTEYHWWDANSQIMLRPPKDTSR